MKYFKCLIGATHRDMVQLVSFIARDGAGIITDAFEKGSLRSGQPDFTLDISFRGWESSLFRTGEKTGVVALNRALSRRIGSASRRSGLGVDKIGLLFSDLLPEHDRVFGMMFDHGVTGSSAWDAVPRQGCAVFVGAIQRAREEGVEFKREILFTAIHELGHIFNLSHIENGQNYMSSSSALGRKAYPDSSFQWANEHRLCLKECSQSRLVHPGGSVFDAFGRCGQVAGTFNKATVNSQFALSIGLDKTEAWGVEPIELDVELSLQGKKQRQWSDNCDPGYEQFRIWIDRPDGTRVNYLPLRRYCLNSKRHRMSPGDKFQRDITIFIQSQGYLFKTPGLYRIELTWEITQGQILRSNQVELEIKSPARGGASVEQMFDYLSKPQVRSILYHRIAAPNSRYLAEITQQSALLKRYRVWLGVAYAAGRAHFACAEVMKQGRARERRLTQAYKLLEVAADRLPDCTRRAVLSKSILHRRYQK